MTTALNNKNLRRKKVTWKEIGVHGLVDRLPHAHPNGSCNEQCDLSTQPTSQSDPCIAQTYYVLVLIVRVAAQYVFFMHDR